MMDDDGTHAAIPRAVGRVLDLFEVVLASGSCNLTTAAATVGLTPTTALRHLRALEQRGYVERDGSGTFSVGPTMLRLASVVRDDGPLEGLIATVQPHLTALASTTGESAYLAVSDGRVATYVATAESERAIRHVGWIGQQVALDGTALGEALANPGRSVMRTGAVEPDITAMSRAIPIDGPLDIAVSIIGPEHRFAEPQRIEHERALDRVIESLIRQLGGEPAVAS
ncbi:MAG: helix-turn-helix domain-containing protein [Ilumatobacter sp.]